MGPEDRGGGSVGTDRRPPTLGKEVTEGPRRGGAAYLSYWYWLRLCS